MVEFFVWVLRMFRKKLQSGTWFCFRLCTCSFSNSYFAPNSCIWLCEKRICFLDFENDYTFLNDTNKGA